MKIRPISQQTMHYGPAFEVRRGVFQVDNWRKDWFVREWTHLRPAAGVVLLNQDDEVFLLEQYRPAINEVIIEIPAGMIDYDLEEGEEAPTAAAVREVKEETGLEIFESEITLLHRYYANVGTSNHELYLYLARLTFDKGDAILANILADRKGPEEEAMNAMVIPLSEAIQKVWDGEIVDSKTTIGLLMAEKVLADAK